MYNRLFTKILDSSIWLECNATRIVWVTLLAAMDEDGIAHFSALENLASRARVSLKEAEKAIECFLSPDINSGNPDNEGRRIERIPGGYIILNSNKYRAIFKREIQREQTRLRVADHRAKNKDVTLCNDLKRSVTQSVSVSTSVSTTTTNQNTENKKEELPDKSGSPHKEFIELWSVAFEAHHKTKYVFGGGKDGSATKSLLSAAKKTPSELVELAKEIWNVSFRLPPFLQSKSVTIAGFASQINELQDAVKKLKRGAQMTNGKPLPIQPDFSKGF